MTHSKHEQSYFRLLPQNDSSWSHEKEKSGRSMKTEPRAVTCVIYNVSCHFSAAVNISKVKGGLPVLQTGNMDI